MLREHELELARTQMEEKEAEHQRQIETQKRNFEAKEEEIKSQKANKEKIDQLTKEIKPLLDEANEIAKQLNQNITFTFGLTVVNGSEKGIAANLTGYALGEKNYDIQVKVNNEQSDEQYIWDRIKFKERLIVMRDLLNTYEEVGAVEDLATDDNPFVDKNEPAIIGEGYFRLEGLSYLMDNPTEINLALFCTFLECFSFVVIKLSMLPEFTMRSKTRDEFLNSLLRTTMNIFSAKRLTLKT